MGSFATAQARFVNKVCGGNKHRGRSSLLNSWRMCAILLFILFCDSSRAFSSTSKTENFKPSLAELTVPFRENPKIVLANFPGQAIVVPLLSGQRSASNYLVHVARQAAHSDPGEFVVEAPKGYGVMAVIQRLHLRRISDTHSLLHLVNNCKDYLEFEGQNGEKTIPICGSLDKDDDSLYPNKLHGPRFFNSNNGIMKVKFRNHYNYGNDILATNDSHVQHNQEMLTVEIAFTAYSRCSASSPGKFHCTKDKCIDASLTCDRIEHCAPGENEGRLGFDEKNCTRSLVHSILFSDNNDNDEFPGLFSSESDDDSVVIIDDNLPEGFEEESKLPNITTIIVLVAILCFITICGYFWGWLSQFCCVARNIIRSANVTDTDNSGGCAEAPSRIITHGDVTRDPGNQRPITYYVPAVVLRPSPGANGMSINDQPGFLKTFSKQDKSDNPPAYDILFPQLKSDTSSPETNDKDKA